jgi:hypothetical protein
VTPARGAALILASLAFAAIGIACAPRRVALPELDVGRRASRYRAALEQRRACGVAEVSLVLWLERAAERRLPGAQADLVMAAPDRLRLRLASLFGTALDVSVRGDSLLAYVPAWKTGLRLGSVSDSLGVRGPGDLAFRAFSATWAPPDEAWAQAVWKEPLLEVRWAEGGDSLAVGVDRSGLPAWVRASRGETFSVRAVYQEWDRSSGPAWPSRFELEDGGHQVRLICKASHMRFRGQADTTRLAARVPADAAVLTVTELRRVLGRLGTL